MRRTNLLLGALLVTTLLAAAPTTSAVQFEDRAEVDPPLEVYMPDILEDATGGKCNGSVDTNCEYCSYRGSNSGSSWDSCDGDSSYYYWATCGVWVSGACTVG